MLVTMAKAERDGKSVVGGVVDETELTCARQGNNKRSSSRREKAKTKQRKKRVTQGRKAREGGGDAKLKMYMKG